jgi:hypothetical protein
MANDITIKDENLNNLNSDLALLSEAAHDLTAGEMVGVPLKFKQGVWSKKNTDDFVKVTATQRFIVDIRSYQHGWIRWQDKRPTHRWMGRKVDGWPLPVRSRLPEPELEGPDDPWKETHRIVMRDLGGDDAPKPTHDGLCTYTTSTVGGKKALGRLIDDYVKLVKEFPGMMPVVYLGSFERPNAYGGTNANPLFTIVEWKEFGHGGSPPGRRIAAPPLPQLNYDGDGNVEPTVMSNGKETKPFDDEIPF